MALLKLKCPECGAGLKSSAGFTPGQTVCCPKCETYFAVEEPAEAEAEEEAEAPKPAKKAVKAAVVEEDGTDEKPKKKKKKKRADDDEEVGGSYKNSPIRYAILGVLVLVLIGLGVALYLKKKNEAAEAKKRDEEAAAEKAREQQPPPPRPKVNPNPNPKVNPKLPPNPNPNPNPPGKGGGLNVGGAVGALDGLLGGSVPADAIALRAKFADALVGTWTANLGGGVTEVLTYKADGTFTATRTGATPTSASGRYVVRHVVGTKTVRVQLDGTQDSKTIGLTVAVSFEGDELLHPSLEKGVTATFRKK